MQEVKTGPQFSAFENRNKIKLRLKWSAEPNSTTIEYPLVDNKENNWPSITFKKKNLSFFLKIDYYFQLQIQGEVVVFKTLMVQWIIHLIN